MKETQPSEWIPNIDIGRDYDQRFLDATIHFDVLQNLADFFGRDMPVHRHAQHIQIHYISHGNINFHIDDQLFQVEGPACFLTPPAVPHSFQTEKGATGYVLTIHQSFLWRLLKQGLQLEPELDLNRGICLSPATMSPGDEGQWSQLVQHIRNIEDEWQHARPAKELALQNHLSLLAIQIARLSAGNANSQPVNNDDLRQFNRFSNLVEQHYKDHWKLPSYMKAMGISESRLNQICHKISNRSPKKLIHDRLVQETKRLLIFSNLSSSEICYKLGFRDTAYFSRFFKSQTGMTTQLYRKQH